MERQMKQKIDKLVVVAHPDDETLGFSKVLNGADIVCITNGGWARNPESRIEEFRRACKEWNANDIKVLNFADCYPWHLPLDSLTNALRTLNLRRYNKIYSHSPFDPHPHHRDASFALALSCYNENIIYVETLGGVATEIYRLSNQQFMKKIKIMNSIYTKEIQPVHDKYDIPISKLSNIELFSMATPNDIITALALTQPKILTDIADTWNFNKSSYERNRYKLTIEILGLIPSSYSIKSIIELGACEGLMTKKLVDIFPHSKIFAVEPNKVFYKRLVNQTKLFSNVSCTNIMAENSRLDADLVLAIEMLYYLGNKLADVLYKINAHYLLTSYYGEFDKQVYNILNQVGWKNIQARSLDPRFELINKANCSLISKRSGTTIRLWEKN